ncbi:sialate O-acetylesterase [Asticcacaulis biprosthecium]|nr:sialate O-acetylesterase [Asticcacaulis biprosthecium]
MKAALVAALLFTALPVQAQILTQDKPLLHDMFQDQAVLQRDRPIPIWGWAAPKAKVTVTFKGSTSTATADKTGKWTLNLPATDAGGPYDLTVKSPNQSVTVNDILVGDVYLCSGQSNMQFAVRQVRNADTEIAHSTDDRVRLLSFDRKSTPTPLDLPLTPIAWKPATPATVTDYSAVCYFFGRDLAKKKKIPIGLIHASWGGSPIQDWTPASGLQALGAYEEGLTTLKAYAKDPEATVTKVVAATDAWADTHDTGTKAGWHAANLDDSNWGEISLPRVWEEQGRADLVDLDGVVWLRKHVVLTEMEAAGPATLTLGTIDERDVTWINGIRVGATVDYRTERSYTLPPGVLKGGDNVIAIRVVDEVGGGGPRSPADKMALDFGGQKLSLAGAWTYCVSADFKKGLPKPPFVPWPGGKGYSTLYNAMIAPIGPYGLSGVLWFQGEQNTHEPQVYAGLLPQMIADWRGQFGKDLPFMIVQLAGYGALNDQPAESGFAAIRDVQRRTAATTPHTGLAVAIDLGNPRDIHSPEKQEVARRLELEAARLVYGEAASPRSPSPQSAVRQGETIRVTFDRQMTTYSGTRPLAFELCAATCVWAEARLDGDTVILEAQPGAIKVRYAWSGSPVVNLYSKDGLPVGTFELNISGGN